MTTVCPHCGTTNRRGSNFCNTCGTDLRDDEATQSSAPDAARSDESISRAAQRAAGEMPPPTDLPEDEADPDGEGSGNQPLPPLFDLGLASPGVERGDELLSNQPWLTAESGEESAQARSQEGEDPAGAMPDAQFSWSHTRLVAGVQGLLDPLNLSSTPTAAARSPRRSGPTPTGPELTSDQTRGIRQAMAAEPLLAAQIAASEPARIPSLRVPWIFLLVGLAIALPVLGMLSDPVGQPQAWPGVAEAYRALENLPGDADVLIYFAYDPATAGEMDMVAEPLLRHLLAQRSNLTFVSLNPNGPATARRLILRVLADDATPSERAIAMQRITVRNYYLTGGAAVLPLLGQASGRFLDAAPETLAMMDSAAFSKAPDLALVLAPGVEDVQHWLELVQPLDGVAVVAATGAGVGPMARPYLDSGQLRGLVSGFDGAQTYERLLGASPSAEKMLATRVQKTAQNWGHFALLFVLLIGNLSALYRRSGQRQGT